MRSFHWLTAFILLSLGFCIFVFFFLLIPRQVSGNIAVGETITPRESGIIIKPLGRFNQEHGSYNLILIEHEQDGVNCYITTANESGISWPQFSPAMSCIKR